MQEIEKIVFNHKNVSEVVENYYKYHQKFDTESDEKIRVLQGSLNSINKKIDNIEKIEKIEMIPINHTRYYCKKHLTNI